MTLTERPDESETIGDDGYRRIRADIVLGRLRPEQKLKLDGLKESYGVDQAALLLCDYAIGTPRMASVKPCVWRSTWNETAGLIFACSLTSRIRRN